ncbi:MAG TPA: dUTPase [Candidatus Nitrosopolaris sp.]
MKNSSTIPSTAEDKLELLFRQQTQLIQEIKNTHNKMQEIYGIKEPFEGYRIFMLSSALMHEVIELQQETAWKWWKTSKELSMEKCQDEVIDVWHFLIQLSIELKMDADTIVSRYLKKNRENIRRQEEGY